jgi:hypothetical protein
MIEPLSCVRTANKRELPTQLKFRAARAAESLCKWESKHCFNKTPNRNETN